MSIKRSALKGIALAAVASFALTACGGGGSEAAPTETLNTEEDVTIVFNWWGNDDRADKYEEAVDLFEEKYPNIKVQTGFQAWDDYWSSRNTEAAGSSLPDVLQMDLSYLRQYGSTNQLLNLDGQIGTSLDVSGLEDSLLEAGKLEGSQYGIATSTNTLAMFYNPDLLEQVGMEALPEDYTWDDLNTFITEASAAGEGAEPRVYGSGDYTTTFWFFLQWLVQQDIQPFTDDGQLNFTREDMTAWLNVAEPIRTPVDATYPISRGIQLLPLGGFTVEENVTEMSWDNFLAGYTADSGNENIQMLPIPSDADGDKKMFLKPSMLLSASANSEHPAAAATLIDFLINDPEVGRIFGTSKGVPAVQAQRDAMELEEGSVDARVVAYEESVAEYATEAAPLPVQGFGTIEAEFKRLGEEFAYRNITVEQYVDQWFTEAEMSVGQ
ncbi:ABC-type sugar transport system, periplasmic component [Sanguibacter keddieii DSM 10542]|uniref:ABC-type sugar transport system, periplasmic component n=1 Tax=Sanguibacter keddieii (strain ATCC 51767 / DSM 10542 / NCFB 3025 / ST-74) TaxID=446469 RepID=D1BAF1_SANKS|nr:extracellular solute-binding protein [Sanguibacter keddieii]ACZ20502.1 ABC-type sugar transport system, periplasmic component [Sanguibacter keddieii DSM 10542]